MSGSARGGFHFGGSVGSFSQSAGGDIVAGDKTTQATTTTTTNNGFRQEDDKQKFLQQIEELRATLRELQAKLAEAPGLSEDAKDEIAAEMAQHVNVLRRAKDEAAGLPAARQPPPGTLQVIESSLASTGTLLDKLAAICDKAIGVGEKVQPYLSKALPILLSARHLFGLP